MAISIIIKQRYIARLIVDTTVFSIQSSNSDCIYIIGHPLHFRQNIGKFNRNIQIKRDFERGNFKFYKRGNKLSMDLVFVYFNQSVNAMVVHQ